LYNAHGISVCVIAVSKSHEFLLKVRRLFSLFFDDDAYAFSSTRRNFFPRRRTLVQSEAQALSDRDVACALQTNNTFHMHVFLSRQHRVVCGLG